MSGSMVWKLGKISPQDEEVLHTCYEDFCTNHPDDKLSFEDFKDLILLGNWEHELPLIYGKEN